MMRFAFALFIVVCCLEAYFSLEEPYPMILHSAYTPWTPLPEQALDVSGVPRLAAQAKKMGVNTVWISGTMSEFDTMSTDERKTLIGAWVKASKEEGFYSIVNVGTTVKEDAKELARFSKEQGADAIATVPPYYTRTTDLQILVDWLADIASATPELPLWYYHIPSVTGTDIAMADLFPLAEKSGLTQMTEKGGIKYVSSDFADFLGTSNWVAEGGRNTTVLFAPEPKLQGFALQNPWAGAVLAEDFYGPTYLRMRAAYEAGDATGAIAEQNWKFFTAEPIFNKYGGQAAKRATYLKSCGVHMGDDRSPGKPFDQAHYHDLVKELDAIGFWDQAPPSGTQYGTKQK